MNKIKPRFISFEGGEGAGKTTQIQILEKLLKSKGIPVIVTREPGGTIGSEYLRGLLKEQSDAHFDAISQALLLYAARRDLVEKRIRPALLKNTWVLCDRFADSTLVYQGFAQGMALESIEKIHQIVLGDFEPDLTFFLNIAPEIGMKRAKERSKSLDLFKYDTFDLKDLDFHKRIHEGFEVLCENTDRIVSVDALLPVDKVTEQIKNTINQRFKLKI